MNPFDWTGPAFLAFYAAFGAGLWWLTLVVIYRKEGKREIPKLNLTDPYEIAVLRGGENEAMRVAAISLVDRGLLRINGDHLKAKEGAVSHVRRAIERAMLDFFSIPQPAYAMYQSIRLKESCDGYRKSLQGKFLLSDKSTLSDRLTYYFWAVALAVAVAWVKIEIAISRDRPFGFLVLLALFLIFLLTRLLTMRRTAHGDRMVKDLQTLFQGLKARAHLLRKGGDTNEVALLVAVYGISALASGHDYAKLLFPKAAKDDGGGGGSSCSTGCGSVGGGGGGGCGGGGCGGCGGD